MSSGYPHYEDSYRPLLVAPSARGEGQVSSFRRFLMLSHTGSTDQRQEPGYEVEGRPSNPMTYSSVRGFQQKPRQVDCLPPGQGVLVAHLSDAEVDRFYAAVGSRVRRARAGRGM